MRTVANLFLSQSIGIDENKIGIDNTNSGIDETNKLVFASGKAG